VYETKTREVRILVIFQHRFMFSHINGKLSPRPFELYEPRTILKNNQSTYHPRFGFTPKTGVAFPKTWFHLTVSSATFIGLHRVEETLVCLFARRCVVFLLIHIVAHCASVKVSLRVMAWISWYHRTDFSRPCPLFFSPFVIERNQVQMCFSIHE